MSRYRKVLHSIGSGYVVLATNIAVTFISVPLALRYLSSEEFGLWALVGQLAAYIALLDLGLGASVGRTLFDVKDHAESGRYGGTLQTGFFVLLAQGALLGVLGVAAAPLLISVLKIPAHLQIEFISIFRWQCLIIGLTLAGRVFHYILVANHRFDILNYVQTGTLLLNLLTIWWAFESGYKLKALPFATAVSAVASIAIWVAACALFRMYPLRHQWGRPSWSQFLYMLNLGKDIFLVTLGFQFLMASQTIIVTRVLGLQSAAIWSVSTKTFGLVAQLVWRIYDFSTSAFAEMVVRKEDQRLSLRFHGIVAVTASLAAFGAMMFAIINDPFVRLWTGPSFAWANTNNVLLGIWLVLVSIVRCHTGHVLVTTQIGALRYIYLAEGIVFLLVANWLAADFGFAGIIATSIASSILFSGAYGIFRSVRLFAVNAAKIVLQWQVPMLRFVAAFAPLALICWFVSVPLSDMLRLAIALGLGAPIGFLLLLRLGLPPEIQAEVLQRAPRTLAAILRPVFPARPQ